MKQLWLLIVFSFVFSAKGQNVALLQYNGGGDWYANPTALENLVEYYNETRESQIRLQKTPVLPEQLLDQSPAFVHATGHGRIFFSPKEAQALRTYLIRGGFLHIDDNYGMKEFALEAMKTVFPEIRPVDVDLNHAIFHIPYEFQAGLPKIHEHDAEVPRALGYYWEGNLVAVLTYETDLGDGWEDPEVHNDPEEKRIEALKMGTNLLHWALLRRTEL